MSQYVFSAPVNYVPQISHSANAKGWKQLGPVCIRCRQRKIKCDRQRPSCKSCIQSLYQCHYGRLKSQKMRSSYVSHLEERLSTLETELLFIKGDQIETPVRVDQCPISSPSDHLAQNHPSSTAPTSPSRPSSPHYSFNPFTKDILNELCNEWFDNYHSWFPILHRPSLFEFLQGWPLLSNTPQYIILQAIVATTLPWSNQFKYVNDGQSESICNGLRGKINRKAMHPGSLQSLQAVLILSIRDVCNGNLMDFRHLIALAKKIATLLDLRDLVARHCDSFGQVSTVSSRAFPLPVSLVDHEEKIRAYWMTEALHGLSTVGVAWKIHISDPLPSSDIVWSSPEAVMNTWSFGNFELSSTFPLFVMLATKELFHVHQFLCQSFDTESLTERLQWQGQCKEIDKRLVDWQQKFETSDLRLILGAYDPNIVVLRCTLDQAIISLYQSLAFPPTGEGNAPDTWFDGIKRCLDGCDSMAKVVGEADLQKTSPLIIPCIFVALRFLLVYSKEFIIDVPPSFHPLKRGLKACSRRWPYARRLEKVIDAVTADLMFPTELSPLPSRFYDLQDLYFNIDETLREWAMNPELWMQMGFWVQSALTGKRVIEPTWAIA